MPTGRADFRRFFILAVLAIILGALAGSMVAARAEDGPGAWWSRPGVRACCSLADAVYADDWRVEAHLCYTPDRVKNEPGNPTGHGVLFLNPGDIDRMICFLPGAGI